MEPYGWPNGLGAKYWDIAIRGSLINLSNAENVQDNDGIPYAGLQVVPSPDPAWQFKDAIQRFISTSGKSVVMDHDISIYANKLLASVLRNNCQT